MVKIDGVEYNNKGLLESTNFKVIIDYSTALSQVAYAVVNKKTNVREIYYCLLADSQQILDDLEAKQVEVSRDPDKKSALSIVSNNKGVH